MKKFTHGSTQNGFSILEVLIGIFIFAVGMLALSSLQGALTRTMADAKVRTTAINIADRDIELQRGFTQLQKVDTTLPAYVDIVDATSTRTVNGVAYTVTRNVTDYYFQRATDSFSTTNTSGVLNSTYKQVVVTVTWDAAQRFRGDAGSEITAANLGTGSITLSTTIPALVTSASARVADEIDDGGEKKGPPVTYNPGNAPDVIALDLGGAKFKESTLPEPDVMRSDELVETRFDVITYSTTGGNTFLRREEFALVSCDCTLQAANPGNPGRRPVIWAGDEYVRGQLAVKPYGTSASNQQSYLCDTCCRDHHDGGTVVTGELPADHATDAKVNTYVPFKDASEFSGGDHKHYSRTGDVVSSTPATAGDDYVEACRMVRQNGFFRVAQDFRSEDRNVFPGDSLDQSSEITAYSSYVTGAVSAFAGDTFTGGYTTSTCIGGPPCVTADLPDKSTTLPLASLDTQQLRSRGVYIDYLSEDMRYVLENCTPGNGYDAESAECKKGDVFLDRAFTDNELELTPFFDVQMTKLNRWNETPTNNPVDTTNEPLADNNTHSRGVISKTGDGDSEVKAESYRGNLGFTDTLPIDMVDSASSTVALVDVEAGTGGPPPPATGRNISGSLSETVPGNPSIVVTGMGGAVCGQTSASYTCFIPDTATSPTLEISGYGKKNNDRYACASGLTNIGPTTISGAGAKATFDLGPVVEGGMYAIVIQSSPCS